MIKVLENPKTCNYFDFKNTILSFRFPFFYEKESTRFEVSGHSNISYYVHEIIKRPERNNLLIPEVVSPFIADATLLAQEILNHNNIKYSTFLRMCVNAVHPFSEVLTTVPHTDHDYDHKNLIVYLTSAGGKTIVGGESYDPVEDGAIIFDGEHYHETPKSERRVVLVATYI